MGQSFELILSLISGSTLIAIVVHIFRVGRYVESTNRRLEAVEKWQDSFFGYSDGTRTSLTEQRLRGEIQIVKAIVDGLIAQIETIKDNMSPRGELDLKHAENQRRFGEMELQQRSILAILETFRQDVPRRQQ